MLTKHFKTFNNCLHFEHFNNKLVTRVLISHFIFAGQQRVSRIILKSDTQYLIYLR